MAVAAQHTTLDPEVSARKVLDILWNGVFPVDPVVIAKQLGLRVITGPLPEDISGVLVKRSGQDPAIILNERDSRNRQRFTCAHEIGHYIYRLETDGDHYEYIDRRDTLSARGVNEEEIFANRFAAALLMPEDEVRVLAEGGEPRYLMAIYFGVSDDAMRFRLKNLGLNG